MFLRVRFVVLYSGYAQAVWVPFLNEVLKILLLMYEYPVLFWADFVFFQVLGLYSQNINWNCYKLFVINCITRHNGHIVIIFCILEQPPYLVGEIFISKL